MTERGPADRQHPAAAGGEVNPDSARHMGLFVVGRLADAARAGVRLRSTTAGNSIRARPPVSICRRRCWPVPTAARLGGRANGTTRPRPRGASSPPFRRAGPRRSGDLQRLADTTEAQRYLTATPRSPVSLLPQRNPGASGITDVPLAGQPAADSRKNRSGPPRTCGPRTRCRAAEPPPEAACGAADRAPTTPRRSSARGCAHTEQRQRPKAEPPAPSLRRSRTAPRSSRSRRRADDVWTADTLARTVADRRPTTTRSTSGCCPNGWSTPRDYGQERRPGLAVGVGSRLVSGRGSRTRPVAGTPSRVCRCAIPAPGWCRVGAATPTERHRAATVATASDNGTASNGG